LLEEPPLPLLEESLLQELLSEELLSEELSELSCEELLLEMPEESLEAPGFFIAERGFDAAS
jgi:hypothetical protein